jgi:hypothetical protein
MLWEEYYEKIDEWANSTAVNRLSKLESFGPPEEIIYVINELAFENEKAATRLLRMATDVGVKFTGEQLAEICLICEESEIERAIRHSCSHFSAADIEALYGCYDDDLVVEVAKKARLPIPEDLQELYEEDRDEVDWSPVKNDAAELHELYKTALKNLYIAWEKVILALRLSIADVNSEKRSLSIAKYACLIEAEPYIAEARVILEQIESKAADAISLRNIRMNLGKLFVWNDTYADGLFGDWIVQRRIQKVLKGIEKAIKVLESLRR